MPNTWTKNTLTAVFCATSLACACSRSQAPNAAPQAGVAALGATNPSEVVAKVGSQTITMGELDEQVGAQLKELQEQQYEIRRQGLEQIINERLSQAAAQKKGISAEQFIKESIETGSTPPTDAAIKSFFDQNSAQLPPGAKLADFKDRIKTFLQRQGQADRAKEVFAELRKDSKVEVLLAPPPKPRVAVEAKGPSQGPDDAKVTIVEFSDFECPFCSRGKASLDKVMEKYKDKVKVVFRQFPLSFHPHAKKASEASLCADAQGKFWPYYDALFNDQKKLADADLKTLAETLKLDKTAFDKCLDSGEMSGRVDEDMAAGAKLGVQGTPAFFINGLQLSGAQPPEEFFRLVDQELAAK